MPMPTKVICRENLKRKAQLSAAPNCTNQPDKTSPTTTEEVIKGSAKSPMVLIEIKAHLKEKSSCIGKG